MSKIVGRYIENLRRHPKIEQRAHDRMMEYLAGEVDDLRSCPIGPGYIEIVIETLFKEWEHAAVNLCESPIERLLLAHMLAGPLHGYAVGPPRLHFPDLGYPPPEADVCIAPQLHIRDMRVDFGLLARRFTKDSKLGIIIECDGHDFHERTKYQAKRDRSRDRSIQAMGFKVLRFTGSEIFRNADKCVEEICDLITNWVDETIDTAIAESNAKHEAVSPC